MRYVRTRTVWSLTIPALILGETFGHAFVVRIFDPNGERHALLARAAEDYLTYLYAAIAICFTLALAALVRRAFASFHGRTARSLPSWQLAGIPPVAFIAQEHLESFFHNGELNWLTFAEPTVLLGAIMQLPCGLLALWLVRTLIRAADALGHALSHCRDRAQARLPARARDLPRPPGRPAPAAGAHARARGARASFVRLMGRPRLRGCRTGVEGKDTCNHKRHRTPDETTSTLWRQLWPSGFTCQTARRG